MENFEIIEKLGSGGFSKVYKVKRKIDNQIYALKKMQTLNLSEKQKQCSLNEVRVLASIQNMNIINYKEAFIDEKDCTLCLVMEYADRGDLENKIEEQKEKEEYFQEEEIWEIFIQLVKGLKSLHDKGIIHRDIKSSNIFLFSDGFAKIGDLNICKVLTSENLGHTQVGTPAYAAPEVWMQKPYGLKSDIWSLGCVLYEMTCLRCPFKEDNMIQLYNKVLIGGYKQIPSEYSDDLKWIIQQMINSDINKRFSCDEILESECVKKRMEKNSNINSDNCSEKEFADIGIENYQESKTKLICKNPTAKKEDNWELLKTIYMPKNLLYLKDDLPKSNYSREIKNNKSIQIHSEKSSSSLLNKIKLDKIHLKDNNNNNNNFLQFKRKSYHSIDYKNKNYNIDFVLNKKLKNARNSIKLHHINSSIFTSPLDRRASLESNFKKYNDSQKKLEKRKSAIDIKKELSLYNKEEEKVLSRDILESSKHDKYKEIKNSLFLNDKIKSIFYSKKNRKDKLIKSFKNIHFNTRIQREIKGKIHFDNQRYNNYNRSSKQAEILNYVNKNDKHHKDSRKKNSIEILPKIKLQHI